MDHKVLQSQSKVVVGLQVRQSGTVGPQRHRPTGNRHGERTLCACARERQPAILPAVFGEIPVHPGYPGVGVIERYIRRRRMPAIPRSHRKGGMWALVSVIQSPHVDSAPFYLRFQYRIIGVGKGWVKRHVGRAHRNGDLSPSAFLHDGLGRAHKGQHTLIIKIPERRFPVSLDGSGITERERDRHRSVSHYAEVFAAVRT